MAALVFNYLWQKNICWWKLIDVIHFRFKCEEDCEELPVISDKDHVTNNVSKFMFDRIFNGNRSYILPTSRYD